MNTSSLLTPLQIDFICQDRNVVMNYSRIWAPVETKINNYITRTQYPIGNQGLLAHSDVVPLHHITGHLHPNKGRFEF